MEYIIPMRTSRRKAIGGKSINDGHADSHYHVIEINLIFALGDIFLTPSDAYLRH